MKTLDQIMSEHGSDKASWAHNYCPNYEQWFNPIRDKELVLLELGIGGEDTEPGGASLLGWKEYFLNATVAGLDIYPKQHLVAGGIHVFQGSQDDKELLEGIVEWITPPDIIIDDASHINELTIKSFQILFPLLKAGGIYVIEDLQCSYRWDFGGSLELSNMLPQTIMNYLFGMLHSLHPIKETANEHYQKPSEFIEIESVNFYPDMVVIKKKI